MKKAKALHIFNSYLPQTENWAYNLISAIPEYEMHIACRNYLKNNFYNQNFKYVKNYFDEFDQINKSLDKKSLSNLFKKLIIKTIPLVFGKTENIFIDYGRENQIHLVHIHFADVGWEFRKVAKKLKIPLVISFYGWDYEKLPFVKPEFRERFKKLFETASAFICEGSHGAAMLESYGCPKEKIFIIKLGVLANKIKVIPRVKKENQLKLVQIASFTEKKGHKYAIDAISNVIKKYPNIELTFIGNENEPMRFEKLKNQVKELKLEDNIRFLPPIDYQDLYKVLANYDVFIHPSCYAKDQDCEGGAPIVLLDAQATGMPVIATTHCDIPDEVIHNKTGLLSPEKNVELLAKNIITFYEMSDLQYQEMAKNARTHIEDNYDIKNNAVELNRVYNKLINR